MNDQATVESIIRCRMHGLYLSRRCEDLETLAHEMLGMHSWFYRNEPFSALIRGADIRGWKTRLTKTWLYRGTLHGVVVSEKAVGHRQIRNNPVYGNRSEQRCPRAKDAQAYPSWY